MNNFFAGVDIGGTTSTICIGDSQGLVLHVSEQFPTAVNEQPEKLLQAIVNALRAGGEKVGFSLAELKVVGLATPGPASIDGVLHSPPNFRADHWKLYPIRAQLEALLKQSGANSTVNYIGDGQAAAWGEYAVRSHYVHGDMIRANPASEAAELDSLCMVIVGTGLGGGEVRGGKVMRGREGRAGHIGHMLLPEFAFRYEHDRRLKVGNSFCSAESAISLTSLTHQLSFRLEQPEWKDHPLAALDTPMKERAKKLRGLAAKSDPLAQQLFDDQARALGIALLNANYLGDYDLMVIGGGVCDLDNQSRQRYRATAEAAYQEYALDGFREHTPFEFSICGDEAPVIGALYHAQASAMI